MKGKNNSLTEFEKRVLDLVKKIPCGKVTTYKIIAGKFKNKKSSRAVGKALSKNKDLINTPCFRVVRNNGEIGGYRKGQIEKIKLLKKDGIQIKKGKIINFSPYNL